MSDPILSVRDLVVSFKIPEGHVEAVRSLSFDVKPGEIVGIVGESGSGKSQTFMSLMGLLASNGRASGQAMFDGQNLIGMPVRELNKIRGKDVSLIFQDPMTALNPYLKIETQLVEALRTHQKGLGRKEAREKAVEMLHRVSIPDPTKRIKQHPHEFSGGMRQRVMIALALLNQPRLVIADEPTTALDVTIQAQILDLLGDLQRDFGTAIVFITHDLGVVAELCDRVMVMYAGKIVESAPVEELFANPQHPYTQGLINATPAAEGEGIGKRLFAIPGSPPNMQSPLKGCAYAPRCYCASERCSAAIPELESAGPEHSRACFEPNPKLTDEIIAAQVKEAMEHA